MQKLQPGYVLLTGDEAIPRNAHQNGKNMIYLEIHRSIVFYWILIIRMYRYLQTYILSFSIGFYIALENYVLILLYSRLSICIYTTNWRKCWIFVYLRIGRTITVHWLFSLAISQVLIHRVISYATIWFKIVDARLLAQTDPVLRVRIGDHNPQ